LLSALSKLEDKIVPRSEASKPGRFARATQAIEEGRYDKTVAVDEDSGWRNRIAFPSKKKEKEKAAQEQENGDETGIYNAMNKDLRTVVEHKLAEHPQEAKVEEERVDLGALAPEGLPKDVTPEEIAALAAAAAQVKGKIAESHTAEPLAEAKAEHRSEVAEQAQSQASQPIAEVVPQAATFAEQKSEEEVESKIEASAEKSGDAVQEPASIPTPSPSDVMAAITRSPPIRGTGLGHTVRRTTLRRSQSPWPPQQEQETAPQHRAGRRFPSLWPLKKPPTLSNKRCARRTRPSPRPRRLMWDNPSRPPKPRVHQLRPRFLPRLPPR
jgi:hypothetical protein